MARFVPSDVRELARRSGWLHRSEVLREWLETHEERRLMRTVRNGRDVCWATTDEPVPLVTVCIPTYDRGRLVADRAIASALAQTHPCIEVLVVGDHCDDATADAVRSVRDDRVRFVNLPARGLYPTDPYRRWLVAGAQPLNAALALARGAWLATCDDDDELCPHHVERLLAAARDRRLELVYGRARVERAIGSWELVGGEPMRRGGIAQGATLFAAALRFFRYSITSWKLGEPADWNLWRRMQRASVRVGFVDEVVAVHYLEAPQREGWTDHHRHRDRTAP